MAVSDTGTGMAPGVAQQATNVFVTTKPHGKGTGLGLRMAHPFASTHSGKISIETAPGQGTAVRFSLPYTGEAEPGRPAVAGLSITACSALLRRSKTLRCAQALSAAFICALQLMQ